MAGIRLAYRDDERQRAAFVGLGVGDGNNRKLGFPFDHHFQSFPVAHREIETGELEYGIAGQVRLLVLRQKCLEGCNVGTNFCRVGLCLGEYQAQRVVAPATVVIVAVTRVFGEAVDAGIVTAAAGHAVVAHAAVESVVAVLAKQAIIAVATKDQVITFVGKNAVVAAAAINGVVAAPGENDVVTLQAKNIVAVASTPDDGHDVPPSSHNERSSTPMVKERETTVRARLAECCFWNPVCGRATPGSLRR
ncbi:MAG: hypothetical protein AW10_02073 [Candidatus Accumulibacter appositus]|uniref:Uncharacterized protein n=1 Tax=Candidatus Accumulibacter appositus TaxID=1454003 RepID=A0A011NBC3_9PROT|nr:MAG: hypothetical protein AW10_02073 [Candidatus Accumulibacter appositus]